MSHPIPQEVEEKLELLTKLLNLREETIDGTDEQGIAKKALLSVYNSGKEATVNDMEQIALTNSKAYSGTFKEKINQHVLLFLDDYRQAYDLSAPSSEDKV